MEKLIVINGQQHRLPTRMDEEVLLLALHYGEVDYDRERQRWVLVARFPLPRQLRRRNCPLLIVLPSDYPAKPPSGILLDRDLPLPARYLNRSNIEGWIWLPLAGSADARRPWRPGAFAAGSDNLLVLLERVRALLDQAA